MQWYDTETVEVSLLIVGGIVVTMSFISRVSSLGSVAHKYLAHNMPVTYCRNTKGFDTYLQEVKLFTIAYSIP
jgi:hypothetical protein